MSQFLILGSKEKTQKLQVLVIRVYYEKIDHILKPLVPKFRPDLLARLKDTAEKQVPAKLKPIVGGQKLCYEAPTCLSIARKWNR